MSSSEQVDGYLARKLGEWWCFITRGHENVGVLERDEWYLRCMHCGHKTNGWQIDPPPIALSSEDIKQVTTDMEDSENNLLGGG